MGKLRCSSSAPSISGTAPRIERKTIEKNRRNRMKNLYSNLVSLIPNHNSKLEGLPLPDQIGEVVGYIKSLKMKLEKIRLRKESLVPTKRYNSHVIAENEITKKRSPLVEVHDMGPNIDVILANGLNDYSKFRDIIRLLNQHGEEIAGASFSKDGNSTVQVLQDKVAKSKLGFGDAALSSKLKKLVCGTSSCEELGESQLDIWDYEIESNIWGFEI